MGRSRFLLLFSSVPLSPEERSIFYRADMAQRFRICPFSWS